MTSVATLPATRPNRIIWSHGNSYKDAAVLCDKAGLALPTAINASLAIELYLKSFLALNVVKPDSRSIGFRAEAGHSFVELLELFEPADRDALFEALRRISDTKDWDQEFGKFSDTFVKTRYWYESTSNICINPEIVDLAIAIGEAVLDVGQRRDA